MLRLNPKRFSGHRRSLHSRIDTEAAIIKFTSWNVPFGWMNFYFIWHSAMKSIYNEILTIYLQNVWLNIFYFSAVEIQLYVIKYSRQRKPSVTTLRSPFSVQFRYISCWQVVVSSKKQYTLYTFSLCRDICYYFTFHPTYKYFSIWTSSSWN